MYKISIYGCTMFKKLVCQWVKYNKKSAGVIVAVTAATANVPGYLTFM